MKTTQLCLNMMGFFLFDWQCGSESMRRSEKKEICGEGSFLQMLDVLRKGKLMTMRNLLQAAS